MAPDDNDSGDDTDSTDDFTSDGTDPFEALLAELAAAPPVPLPLAPKVGDVLADRYRILEPLGSGAMGNVYRVADQHLGEDVALKLLHPRLAAASRHDSLRTEVRMARRIAHPNVCRVHDLGSEGERLFVTMELLGGRTLREWIGRRREIGLPACIDILVQVASGLAAAHRAGVIHGDVKPDNVILDRERAVLTDFGIARLLSDHSEAREFPANVAGTPAYMAPELSSDEPADRRVDTYSFGILAYELLVGERPPLVGTGTSFATGTEPRTAALPDDLPTDVAEPEIRQALLAVLKRATARLPGERPDPIGVLASLLSRAANGEIPMSGRRRRPRTQAPHRVVTALHLRVADGVQPSTPPRFHDEEFERVITNLSGVVVSADDRCLEAVFGAPRTVGGEAFRAARAALALVKKISYAAVGVHTGTVELSAAGGGSPLASGDALATARAVASDRGVICSAVAGAQLAGHFDLTRRSDGSFNLHRGLPAITAVANTVHGRSEELAELSQRFAESFTQRRTGVVRVVGPAGIGKTQLVNQFISHLRGRRDVDVIRADAAPFADAGPLVRLRGELGRDPAEKSNASHQQLRARLLARAADKPCLLVVDDLQWADAGSREFLAELENLTLEAALGCVFIARSQSLLWPPASMTHTLELGGLKDQDIEALVHEIAPELTGEQLTNVLERAQGNPLLAAEIGRAVEAGRSLPSSAIAAAQELCDSLGRSERDLIARAAAYGASFSTEDIYLDSECENSSGCDIAAVELVKRGVLRVESRTESTKTEPIRYRFVSPLVREVVYEQTPVASRLAWHLAYAEHLESSSIEPSVEQLSALAQHLERGGQGDRAGAAFGRAGALALSHGASSDAAGLLARAVELTSPTDIEAQLLTNLGIAVQTTDGAGAEEHFYRAFSMTSHGDELRPRLCHYLGIRAAGRSDNLAARTWFQRGLDEVDDVAKHDVAKRDDNSGNETLGNEPPISRTVIRALLLASLGSLVGYDLHEPAAGLELSETAVTLLESSGHKRELANALSSLGGNYMRAGRWIDQLQCNQRNLDIAIELGDARAELRARINLGVVQCNLGRLDDAITNTRASFNLALELGDSVSRSLALHNLGMLLVESGDLDGGVERIHAAIELGRRVGYDRFLDESYACLSRVAFLRGELEIAEREAHSAVGVSVASGSEISEGISLRFLAAALAHRGQIAEALKNLERAHQCLSERDSYEDSRTSVVEARILRLRGGDGDAHRSAELLEQARMEFARLGAVRDLERLNDRRDLR